MIAANHPAEQMRIVAWYGLAAVAAYYSLASLTLRWHRRSGVRVAKYDPPQISPAAAAYLWERGVSDKPFVVALANMVSKGLLKIEQGPNDYLLSGGDSSAELEDEEELIAEKLFRGQQAQSVCLSKLFLLGQIARDVRASIESEVEPDLISPHFAWFIPGLTLSLGCLLAALYPELEGLHSGIVVLPAFAAVWALLATIKTLPAVVYKLKSHLPGQTPNPLPMVKQDRVVLVMLLVALASLAVLGWITSPVFALQLGGLLLANLLGMIALRAPTAAGRALLEQLSDFRMFLAQVDADRVNRMNAPAAPSPAREKYWVWALALDVEHAWGEQFTAAILNRIGPAAAMASIESTAPEEGRRAAEVIDLHLR